MRLRVVAVTALVAASLLAPPAPALAERIAPPDNSSVQQYVPGLPTDSGERAAADLRCAEGSQATRRDIVGRLRAGGADGAAAGSLALATSPACGRSARARGGADDGLSAPALVGIGSGPLGWAVAVALALTILGALGRGLRRRRADG